MEKLNILNAKISILCEKIYHLGKKKKIPVVITALIIFLQVLLSLLYLLAVPTVYVPLTIKTSIIYLIPFLAVIYSIYTIIIHYKKYKSTNIFWDLFSPTALLGILFLLKLIYYSTGQQNYDDYHYGEIIVPFFEYIYYGMIPFKEIISPHGFIDAFGSLLSYYLLDDLGIYGINLSISITQNYFMMLIVIVSSRILPFYLSLLILFINNYIYNYLIILFILYVFFSKIRYEIYIVLYGLLSFLFFLISPSYGGAAIIATIPYVIYLTIKYINNNSEINKIIYLFFIAVCFLFLFLYYKDIYVSAIVHLLFDGQSNIYAYGTPITSLLLFFKKGIQYVLLPFMVVWAIKEYLDKQYKSFFIILTALLITLILTSYSVGRMDGGIRAYIFSPAILFIIMLSIHYSLNKRKEIFIFILLLIGVNYLNDSYKLINKTQINKFNNILNHRTYTKYQISNNFTNMAHHHYLNEIRFIEYVLDEFNASSNDLLILSNRNALYYYLKQQNPIPAMAYYNLGNPKEVYKFVEQLNGFYPKIIHINRVIKHDELSLSIRANALYRYLILSNKYSILRDNNSETVLLVQSDNASLKSGFNLLDDIIGQKDLKYLPSAWGGSIQSLKDYLIEKNIDYKINNYGNNSYIDIVFSKPVNISDIDYLYIDRNKEIPTQFEITYNNSEKLSYNNILTFSSNTKENLVPLDALPSWLLAKNITQIRISSKNMINNIKIKFYKNKKNIEYGL